MNWWMLTELTNSALYVSMLMSFQVSEHVFPTKMLQSNPQVAS